MSQENVEVVVSALEKWNSGDDTGALESLAADVEVHHNIGRGTPLEGIYQGHAEVRKLWADIREFAEARFDIARAAEHDGVVLVLGTLRLRGTGSGAADSRDRDGLGLRGGEGRSPGAPLGEPTRDTLHLSGAGLSRHRTVHWGSA